MLINLKASVILILMCALLKQYKCEFRCTHLIDRFKFQIVAITPKFLNSKSLQLQVLITIYKIQFESSKMSGFKRISEKRFKKFGHQKDSIKICFVTNVSQNAEFKKKNRIIRILLW